MKEMIEILFLYQILKVDCEDSTLIKIFLFMRWFDGKQRQLVVEEEFLEDLGAPQPWSPVGWCLKVAAIVLKKERSSNSKHYHLLLCTRKAVQNKGKILTSERKDLEG